MTSTSASIVAAGSAGGRARFARGVEADAALAARDAQQPAVVHAVEQLGRRVARAAKPVRHLAVREVGIHLARMDDAVLAHEVQHRLRLLPARLRPRLARGARMHQRVQRARHEAVVDEEVLLDRQPRIAALEVARAVAGHAMAQRQVLRACRGADRVGLHEAELLDRLRQRRRLEQRAGDRVAAQVVEGRRLHGWL